MQDRAELSEVKIKWPSIFPVNAVKMMRIAIIAEEENKLVEFASLCFKSYWEDDLDVRDNDILERIIKNFGMDPSITYHSIQKETVKNTFIINTLM